MQMDITKKLRIFIPTFKTKSITEDKAECYIIIKFSAIIVLLSISFFVSVNIC